LIQDELNKKNIRIELQKILTPEYRENLLKQYDLLEEKLGGDGASHKTASLIIKHLT
jgi:lipid-A-disaccharide synthase